MARVLKRYYVRQDFHRRDFWHVWDRNDGRIQCGFYDTEREAVTQAYVCNYLHERPEADRVPGQ